MCLWFSSVLGKVTSCDSWWWRWSFMPSISLPQASSVGKLGIVSGWRSNEWISQHSAIHYLLHSGSEWLATALRTRMLQRTSRQEQGPACQSNCHGKHKAEKTAGPLFPYAARGCALTCWLSCIWSTGEGEGEKRGLGCDWRRNYELALTLLQYKRLKMFGHVQQCEHALACQTSQVCIHV